MGNGGCRDIISLYCSLLVSGLRVMMVKVALSPGGRFIVCTRGMVVVRARSRLALGLLEIMRSSCINALSSNLVTVNFDILYSVILNALLGV